MHAAAGHRRRAARNRERRVFKPAGTRRMRVNTRGMQSDDRELRACKCSKPAGTFAQDDERSARSHACERV